MSNTTLLEQAIIDAQALRDAALKNAQEALLEKHAPQIKEAVEKLLEQEGGMPPDETAQGDMGDAGIDLSAVEDDTGMGKGEVAGVSKKIPLAATDGEKLCACPDEDEEIEINFDELEKQMRAQEDEEDMGHEDLASQLDMSTDVSGTPPGQESDEDIELKEFIDEIMSQPTVEDTTGLTEEDFLTLTREQDMESSKEEGHMCEVEHPMMTHEQWENESMGNVLETQPAFMNEAKKLLNASEVILTEHRKVAESNKKLSLLVEQKDEKIGLLTEENNKFKTLLKEMSESLKKLDEVNLMNARLFYTNHVLKSVSLNERQKDKIVDAISKVSTVNEAKTVYETLVDSMGGSGKSEHKPKSLNETLTKKSSFRLPHNTVQADDPSKDRWQKLAGIKTK